MNLIGVDPGGTTGLVYTRLEDGKFSFVDTKQVGNTGQVIAFIKSGPRDIVIAEAFVLRKEKALQLSGQRMVASEVFGAVASCCQELGVEFVIQQPYCKDAVSKGLLKGTILWQGTVGLPHARDAARHVLYYSLKNKLLKLV